MLMLGCPAMHAADRDVLVTIYKALNGAEWGDRYNKWNTDAPLKEWKGVKVETDAAGNERVVELNINVGRKAKGNMPADIAQLTELRSLAYTVGNESNAASIPACVWSMNKLTKLHIGLYGGERITLPAKMDLPNLKSLYLSRVQGPFDVLCTLTSLENLEVDNFKGALPEKVDALVNLKRFSWTSSSAPEGRVPAAFARLSKLEHLQIDYNTGFAGGIKAPDVPFPVEIWGMPSLRVIFLRAVSAQPSTIPAKKVAAMTSLESITVCDCGIEGKIPAEFFKSGKLTSFSIYDNNLTGSIPKEIGNCTKLQTVMLLNNKLSGTIPASLGNCTKLFTLWLYDNPELGGKIPEEIAKCEKLSIFGLKNTKVSQDVPAAVQAHPNYSKWRLF